MTSFHPISTPSSTKLRKSPNPCLYWVSKISLKIFLDKQYLVPYNTPYHSASQCASSPVLCVPYSSPLACMARYSDADDAIASHLERARTCRQFPFASSSRSGGSEWRLRCDAHNATRHRAAGVWRIRFAASMRRVFRASGVPRHVARRGRMMRGALACGVGCLRQAA